MTSPPSIGAATHEPRAPRSIPRSLIGPMFLGAMFSVAPIELLVFLLPLGLTFFVIRESWRRRREPLMPLLVYRVMAMFGVVAAAWFAPVKFEDHVVDAGRARFVNSPHGSELMDPSQRLAMWFPAGVTRESLQLPAEPMPLKQLVRHVERVTGMQGHIGFCGNGESILWGAAPIGGAYFQPAQRPVPLPGSDPPAHP